MQCFYILHAQSAETLTASQSAADILSARVRSYLSFSKLKSRILKTPPQELIP